MTLQINLMCHS